MSKKSQTQKKVRIKNPSLVRKIATWVITVIMTSVFVLDIFTYVFCNKYEKNFDITEETFDYPQTLTAFCLKATVISRL